eukprot:6824694-Heterocapsa_arctica.AAC.1
MAKVAASTAAVDYAVFVQYAFRRSTGYYYYYYYYYYIINSLCLTTSLIAFRPPTAIFKGSR